jgi:hypothetical protein
MKRKYDLFEKFADGSTLWRACVQGLVGTQIHLKELAQCSGNQFYAIEMLSGKIVRVNSDRIGLHLLPPQNARQASKSAVA